MLIFISIQLSEMNGTERVNAISTLDFWKYFLTWYQNLQLSITSVLEKKSANENNYLLWFLKGYILGLENIVMLFLLKVKC